MHSAVGRLWTLFARTVGKWEGTWCAYCAGYVTHNAGDAHPTRVDQASAAAGMPQASARSSVRLAPVSGSMNGARLFRPLQSSRRG